MSKQDVVNLTNNIKKTIKLAFYKNNTGYMKKFGNFMNNYNLLLKNGKFVFNVYSKTKDNLGNNVRIDIIVGGRKTHWVSCVQK